MIRSILIVLGFATVASGQVADMSTWTQCGPQGCPPQYYMPPQGHFQPPRQQWTPPADSPPQFVPRPLVPVQPIPQQPNPEVPKPQTDGDGLKSLLVTLNQNVSNLSVKVEQIGNCECKPADLTEVTNTLNQISLTQQMILAKCGGTAEIPTAVVHYVLVADEGASYWRRVNDMLTRAREAYSQIRSTPPPSFPVGALPQLVAYENGKPLGAFKGQRDVENALAVISKGETPKP